ncbi:pilus assembly protein [Denitrificimonas sp. JX-1]|uniref:Pilus assembly protein n=1 Tax=Denitrificimonas halotolerans TaxID=3098930 RepID=A0ABU5GSE0_9GAMM|nr:pilus assembly protein [Denitrificimonas sp. JX-1]MDY7219522.1 pilus assembly protein [Denitrificimonas sp. JX-1]
MEQVYLAVSENTDDLGWLQETLAPMGQVLQASDQLEELLGLMDVVNTHVVFLGVDADNMVQQCALIESLLAARPLVVVVCIGDGQNNQLVLSAMRAGARDFISYGLRSSEVQGLVRRIMERLPQLPVRKEQGGLITLCGSEADNNASFVAAHLALMLHKQVGSALFIDLGLPEEESTVLLGVESSFTFGDALRNLRRLDSNLISSAFAEHASGMKVLPGVLNRRVLDQASSAELFLLLGTLRQNFSLIVINTCGLEDSHALRTLINASEQLLWYVTQSVSSCKRNLQYLQSWQRQNVKLDSIKVLVDCYEPDVAPDAITLARSFEAPLLGHITHAPKLRLQALNLARPVFEMGGRAALGKELSSIAQSLAGKKVGGKKGGVLSQLLGKLQ